MAIAFAKGFFSWFFVFQMQTRTEMQVSIHPKKTTLIFPMLEFLELDDGGQKPFRFHFSFLILLFLSLPNVLMLPLVSCLWLAVMCIEQIKDCQKTPVFAVHIYRLNVIIVIIVIEVEVALKWSELSFPLAIMNFRLATMTSGRLIVRGWQGFLQQKYDLVCVM